MAKTLYRKDIQFGCDPEFFFTRRGKVIGSERVLDMETGLLIPRPLGSKNASMANMESKFIVDGVQAELNPRADTCRARLGNEISHCFTVLREELKKDKTISVCFNNTVKVPKKELESLDKRSRILGCSPSFNTDEQISGKLPENAATKPIRSAGGHIHLGRGDITVKAFDNPPRLVNMLDIIVGNTCVMLDRDEGNVERRKTYGRAGEFRVPAHGIEYRTLSNFWLRSYPLYSFVMSISRLAVSIIENSTPENDIEKDILDLVNMEDIHKAINTNDLKLATANFNKIKDYLSEINSDYTGYMYTDYPFTPVRVKGFEYVVKKGIDKLFKEDPIDHWANLPEAHTCGWENFLTQKIIPKIKA